MSQANQAGVIPPLDLVRTARTFVQSQGTQRAATALGVSRSSLASLVAGLRVRRGTIALVAQGLGWSERADSNPPPHAA